MKVRRTEFLLFVAIVSSAIAMQIREQMLPAATSTEPSQQEAVTCNAPGATGGDAVGVLQASCERGATRDESGGEGRGEADTDPHQLQGTLRHVPGKPKHLQLEV